MHAASARGAPIRFVKGGAFALLALVSVAVTGCTTSGSDNPSVAPPSTLAPLPAGKGASGPAIGLIRVQGIPVPQLAGHDTANAALRAIGAGLRGTCSVSTSRDDPKLASFVWDCGPHGPATATVDLGDDRILALSDLLMGSFASYLSSVASAQLETDGVANPSTTNLSAWSLTPASVAIAFPAGTVYFPIATLGPYIKRPGPLSS